MLQSAELPTAPEPATAVADILGLKSQQRFHLMAAPTKVLSKRRAGCAQIVADIQIADGSALSPEKVDVLATLPLTVLFKNEVDSDAVDAHVAKAPLLFMCLNGTVEAGTVSVNTVKDYFFWQAAVGRRKD